MNNKIIKLLNLPKGLNTFFTPFTTLEVYSRKRFESFVKTRRRIFISGPGFDNNIEATRNTKILKLINKIALELSGYNSIGIVTGCCSDYSISSMIVKRLKELAPDYPVLGVSRYSKLPKKTKYKSLKKIHDAILYCGYDQIELPYSWKFAPQDLIQIMISDCILSVHGSIGTNHELSMAYELQKPAGLIIGFNGVTDIHPALIKSIKKEGRKDIQVTYNKDPKKVIKSLLKLLMT